MITVRLNGGMGNQMFQFAACHALALRLGTDCKVDLSTFRRSIRKYELDNFARAPQVANNNELPLASKLAQRGMPATVADAIGRILAGKSMFEERFPFRFDERFLDIHDGSYLIGYFQSEKYFENFSTEIRNFFTFKHPLSAASKEILDQMGGPSSVSVHVRRGDYISVPKTNKIHGTCSLEYYQAAFRIISERLKAPRLFVFSDDPTWAKENIKLPAKTVYVDHAGNRPAHEDMQLMSNCRHHIIANSSFSWWAAWLNPSPRKLVIAPRRWVNDASVELSDLFPQGWTPI